MRCSSLTSPSGVPSFNMLVLSLYLVLSCFSPGLTETVSGGDQELYRHFKVIRIDPPIADRPRVKELLENGMTFYAVQGGQGVRLHVQLALCTGCCR